jgi:hypothetical protein
MKQNLPLTFAFSQGDAFLLEMRPLLCCFEFAGISCGFREQPSRIAYAVLERKISQILFHNLGHKHI